MKRALFVLLILVLLTVPPVSAAPQRTPDAPLAGYPLNGSYTQDFNTLAASGTSSTVPSGWAFSESGSNANTTYAAGTGSDNAGNTYSFGASGNSERAFGGLQSGSLIPTIGAEFTNATGATIVGLTISYNCEQWRSGVASRNAADRLDFQYSTNAISLTTGTWVDVNSLDCLTTAISTTVGAKDGNNSAYRTAVSGSILNLNITDGATFWLRWTDYNITSSDDGLAVDDFAMDLTTAANQPVVPTCPPSMTTIVGTATSAAISATDADGVVVSAAITNGGATGIGLSGIVPAGSPGGTLTGQLDVGTSAAVGNYSVEITFQNNDVVPQTANCTVPITVRAPFGNCGDPATLIHAVQGSGSTSPLDGTVDVIVEGIVGGDYQEPVTEFGGFYLQEESADFDADAATSEGLFIYDNAFGPDVSLGDKVRARGTVYEYVSSGQTLTELKTITELAVCSSGNSVSPMAISLPFPNATHAERYEGMLVTFPQELTVTDNYTLGRYGEVGLSSDGRLYQPTNIVPPGPAAVAQQELNNLRKIVLDDGNNQQNRDPITYPAPGGLNATNTLRGGDTVSGLTGVLDQRFGVYRLQPVGVVSFVHSNPRTAAPEPVGGMLRVAGGNVLNYFNGDGLGGGFPAPRGATSAQEFTRQRDKIFAEILGVDPDVMGLAEIENDAPPNSAIEDLVSGLNNLAGAGTYAFIDTGIVGADQIRVGLIYKPATVTPVGAFMTDLDPVFSRPPVAQTFMQNSNGEMFSVVVNHFKSKGSCPAAGDPNADQGDGQSCWNLLRMQQAAKLVDMIENVIIPTSGDRDVLIIGDLNAYALEDPVGVLEAAGYNDLIAAFDGLQSYSYSYQAQYGYLDHALANATLWSQVTGLTHWHTNADEPVALDYNTEFKSAGQIISLYAPDPARAADHDVVVVGLNLVPAPDLMVLGWVFFDTNGNGWRDAGETPGLAGVWLTLTQNGAPVATAPSVGTTGWYQFINIPPGHYCLKAAIPGGYIATSPTEYCFDKVDGQGVAFNFGVQQKPPASIGDLIWYDANHNGIQDAGEAGIAGVTVALWSDAGGAPGSILKTTTTASDGTYLFSNLAPGSYWVDVTDEQGILAGLTLVAGPQSKPDPFGPVALTYGEAILDADFGYAFVCATNSGVIGDLVWQDTNANGAQDAGEPGLAGVQVCAEPIGYRAIRCTITNPQGVYRLCVPQGTYLVAPVTRPAGFVPGQWKFKLPLVVRFGGEYLDVDFSFVPAGQ